MGSGRLSQIKHWALYYGTLNPPALSRYDLVVVAPQAWRGDALARLRAGGARVLAYLSVLEVPKGRREPPPANVLRVDGRAADQPTWSTWILDPRRAETAARVYDQALTLMGQGFDGLFLDTLGDVEDQRLPPGLRSRLIPAVAHLVAGVRARIGGGLLVSNWGLGLLLDLTLPYVDAVCWEDFPMGPPAQWQVELAKRLAEVAAQGVGVLSLSLADSPRPAWADELGLPWYGAPGSYTEFHGGQKP